MKILLLEDDLILNEIIEEHLISQKHEITTVFTGLEAQDLLYSQKFDLLLLDVNVPILNGFELLKELRQKEIYTPAIFLTSLNQVSDIEEGFKSGCDDYIKKPFDFDELLIRINAILKKQYHTYSNELTLDDFHFFIEKNELYKSDIFIPLTPYELKLVLLFFKNINTTLTKDFLIDSLDDFKDISEGALRVHITNLRKIGLPIATIKGIGYRFASS